MGVVEDPLLCSCDIERVVLQLHSGEGSTMSPSMAEANWLEVWLELRLAVRVYKTSPRTLLCHS